MSESKQPMDAETLEALRGSIRKWEAIVAGTGKDDGPSNCPLCQKFYWNEPDCAGCPVSEATGHSLCDGSPYQELTKLKPNAYRYRYEPGTAAYRKIAKRELDFLKSLLPTGAA